MSEYQSNLTTDSINVGELLEERNALKARVEELECENAKQAGFIRGAMRSTVSGERVVDSIVETMRDEPKLREAARLLKDLAGYASLMIQSRELQRTEGANSSVAEYALEEKERAAFASIKALLRDPSHAELVASLEEKG